MVIAQTLPLSIGASVANAIFAPGQGREGPPTQPRPSGPWRATLSDVGATAVGAIFISANVAPTEEIPMLAAALTSGHQLALIGVTLIITYGIVFASGFAPAQRPPRSTGIFRGPLSETAMAYAVSLLVALGALVLFDQVGGADPLMSAVTQVLVLGLPSAVGGAAGRLVL
jgi:putative integral membrane protein (TIGR02587 family)